MKKIFVGNLSWKATEETLRPLFEAYGSVISIKIVTDQYTGKSKGFAFVEMESSEAAKASIDGLNEKLVLDRNIRVSLAQERTERREFTPRGPGGSSNGNGGGSRGGNGGGNGGGFRSGR